MPRTPQDHEPKGERYSFTVAVDGKPKTFAMPSAEAAASASQRLPGKFLRDAFMDPEEGEARLAFATLEAADADPEMLEALYSLPGAEMLSHIRQWMQHKSPSGEDASLGESSGSSA